MARSHAGMPRPGPVTITKTSILAALQTIDSDPTALARVLAMETDFRQRIGSHVGSLPLGDARFSRFNTNPFVLLFHSFNRKYSRITEIEKDILPAKVFSSMETSAGRMVETVALPIYGWSAAPSGTHTTDSVIDGRRVDGTVLRLTTLKSGPRCLNDEMSKDIADDIVENCLEWANAAGLTEIDFTYGVLYGTKKRSNKKDWHVLRNIESKLPAAAVKTPPAQRWDCAFERSGIPVTVTVRIGMDLWSHIAGHDAAFLEIAIAAIRACIIPAQSSGTQHVFTISDLQSIVSTDAVPTSFNVSILQRSQLEWLFFIARHFCDELVNA